MPTGIDFYEENMTSDVTLADWLHVDADDYAVVDIANLGLSVRSYNCLRRVHCTNLSNILALDLESLIQIKNLGKKSVDEIIQRISEYFKAEAEETIQNCLDSSNGKQYDFFDESKQMVTLPSATLKPEMYNLLVNLSTYISEMDDKSEEYESVSELLLSILPDSFLPKNRIRKAFRARFSENLLFRPELFIPTTIRELPIDPFITAYSSISEEVFLNNNSKNLSVISWVNQLDNAERKAIADFLIWLGRDVKSLIENVFDESKYQSRQLTVIKYRASGKTLEEIGKEFFLTRERVRQIETKGRLQIVRALEANNFIPYVFAILGAPLSISKADMRKFMSDEQVDILWFILENESYDHDLKCSISKNYNGLIFNSTNKRMASQIEEAVSELPDILSRDEMDQELYSLSIDYGYDIDLLLTAVSQRFISYPEVYSSRKLPLIGMVEYIFKEKYPKGIHATENTERESFVKELRTCFGIADDISQSHFVNLISKVGILYNKGTYIPKSSVNVDAENLDTINNYIESQTTRTTISYNELFDRFKDLLEKAGVNSPYYLHGLLSYYGCPYSVGKDYVYKNEERNFDEDFVAYVREHYPVAKPSLKKHFALSDVQYKQIIERNPSLVTKGSMVFYHPTIS